MISDIRKEKLNSIASKIGVEVLFELAERKGNDYNVGVRCLKCGNVEVRHVSNLMKGAFECTSCIVNNQKEKLSSLNYTFIEVVRKEGSYSKFYCNSCGNVRELSFSNVINMKSIRCSCCRKIEVTHILEDYGCKYVREFYNGSIKKIEYLDINGDTRVSAEANILRKIFSKSKSHWDQKHYLYIFESLDSNFPYIKIGTANNPEKRLKDLKLLFDCKIYSREYPSRFYANAVEQEIHSKYKDLELDRSEAESFTFGYGKQQNGVRKKMGVTEWFKNSFIDNVLNDYCFNIE